jgi:16S rRNA C1402 N4-methylase RsmH
VGADYEIRHYSLKKICSMMFVLRIRGPYLCQRRFFSQKISDSKIDYVIPTPIFHKEMLEWLEPKPDQKFLDMTFGIGGHSSLLLDHCPDVQIIASDCDPVSVRAGATLAKKYRDGNLTCIHSTFSSLPEKLRNLDIGLNHFDGILLHTGCSSFQMSDK